MDNEEVINNQEENNDDIGDLNLDDDGAGEADDGTISVSKEEWERVNEFVSEGERKAAYDNTVSAIKADIPDFNEKAVVDHLKELNKINPDKANEYNSEAGFKSIWYELQSKAVKDDAVNGGNNKGSNGSDFDSVLDGAMQGKTGSLKQAISMAL